MPPPMAPAPSAAARWGSAINKVRAINRFKPAAVGFGHGVAREYLFAYFPIDLDRVVMSTVLSHAYPCFVQQPYMPTPPPAPAPVPAPAPAGTSRWGSAIKKVQAANRFRKKELLPCFTSSLTCLHTDLPEYIRYILCLSVCCVYIIYTL